MMSKKISIERFFSNPIIYPNMDDRMGSNINGPAIIRMPNWCKEKLGTYHLYFSDHKGKYIRLAFADEIIGPWKVYSPGAAGDAVHSRIPQNKCITSIKSSPHEGRRGRRRRRHG